jgi:DNA-binding transcriptional MerR regulator
MATGVAIGEAARQSGVKAPTIRYYEQIGLLPAPYRAGNNRRHYEASDLRRLAFIRHARELGFEIAAIRSLLTLQDRPDQTCAIVHGLAKERLEDVVGRIRSLTALQDELELMIEGCKQGHVADCRVIEVLADHGKCAHSHH